MKFRQIWPAALAVIACGYALFVFDWGVVSRTLLSFDIVRFVILGGALVLVSFISQTLRWTAISGLPLKPVTLWETHLQSSVSAAAALTTPFAVGDALKVKLARDSSQQALGTLGAAFLIERGADLTALAGLAVLGLGLRGSASMLLTVVFCLLLLSVMAAPILTRTFATYVPSKRLARILEPVRSYKPSIARMLIFAAGTAARWAAITELWRLTLGCAGIPLEIADASVLVAGVTLAAFSSLVPAGIGVSDVTARAILIWLGVPAGLADTGAVALRLLSPLIIGLALMHAPLLLKRAAKLRA
jgi:uncharacterized membrane protein YbhN (UPF0104 family)